MPAARISPYGVASTDSSLLAERNGAYTTFRLKSVMLIRGALFVAGTVML
jgi:hypothetical protein